MLPTQNATTAISRLAQTRIRSPNPSSPRHPPPASQSRNLAESRKPTSPSSHLLVVNVGSERSAATAPSPVVRIAERLGSLCDFSNRSRRVSHTKQLVDDFSSLTTRLQSIDESIAKVAQHIQTQNGNPIHTTTSSTAPLAAPCAQLEPQDLELISPALNNECPRTSVGSTSYQDILRPMSHVVDARGNERYFGPTASLSLFEASRQLLKSLLEADVQSQNPFSKSGDAVDISQLFASNPSFKSKLNAQYDSFPFDHNCEPIDPSGDALPVACPPRSFLDASLICFLQEINSVTPIFHERALLESINQHYSVEESERSESKNLCFNNIIILASTAKLRKARLSAAMNTMEEEFLRSFLSNTSRALGNLENFCGPSILNAQTLITLIFVAREYYAGQVADTLCHRACHMIRLMGLHQSSVLDKTLNKSESEREMIYWTLYIMDKQRTFMTGQPCNLYLFDSDLSLLITNNSSRMRKLNLTHLHLMAIWEEIYINLHSQRAMRLGPLRDQEKVTGYLFGLLRKWTSNYSELLGQSSDEDPSPASYLQMELKYCFHVAQVLILRHSSTPANAQLCITNARAAVGVIIDIYRAGSTVGSMSLLARIFRNYPVVAFLELHGSSFGSSATQLASNLQLLSQCSEVLASLKDNPHSDKAYYSRLYLGLSWYSENLTLLLDAVESRHQISRDSSHAPSGSTTSASSSDAPLQNPQSTSDIFLRTSPHQEISGSFDANLPAGSIGSMWETRCNFGPLTFAGDPKALLVNLNPVTSIYSSTSHSNISTDSIFKPRDLMSIDEIPLQATFPLDQYFPPELDGLPPGNADPDMFSAINFPTQLDIDYDVMDMANWDSSLSRTL